MHTVFTTLYQGFLKLVKHNPTGQEFIKCSNSIAVAIIIPNKGLLVVQQERPAMINNNNPFGQITEVIAGRFDRRLSIKELIIAETKEEAGITVREDQIIILNDSQSLAMSPGISSERITLAYAIVTEDQITDDKEVFGLPNEGEQTKRIFIPLDQINSYVWADLKSFALAQYLCAKKIF